MSSTPISPREISTTSQTNLPTT